MGQYGSTMEQRMSGGWYTVRSSLQLATVAKIVDNIIT